MQALPTEASHAFRLPAQAVVAALGSDASRGLTDPEARMRLERFGRNELAQARRVPGWKKFLSQLTDLLVVLLLVATALSVGIWLFEGDSALPYEAMAIFAVVLTNAAMGTIQQSRAEAALLALKAMTAAEATVIRSGERRRIPAAELVPGDIILIEEGDAIPADARLIEETALQAAEASLTGESLPVSKDAAPLEGEVGLGDRQNMVFSGTAATYGRGKAVVTATGMQTEMGRIAGLLETTREQATPLQKELHRTGKVLGLAVAVIAVVMVATLILVEDVRGAPAFFEVLILGVALAVAAVPEGLPAVVTAVLSLGVQRMARRKAIVRHLAAVETLGSANVIATDKTGTLTRNEMTVRKVVTASGRFVFEGSGYAPEGAVRREDGGALEGEVLVELRRALAAADRANNASVQRREGRWTVLGDPTEGALLVAARKAGLGGEALEARLPRVGEVPFSSERKLMTTLHLDAEDEDRLIVFSKGAPDVLLARCTHELVGAGRRPLTAERRAEILRVNDALADEALRTLAVAVRWLPREAVAPGEEPGPHVEQGLSFAGLIGMFDPPRAEARQAVAQALSAGIRPVMITGDHPRTARVIARELGIAEDGRALTGAELDRLPVEELARAANEVSVYARVNPGHKLRIVEAFRRDGLVVAMTGDGVNDAPALKAADIGVAMGITGTEVAKGASDIVLADDNFATIVAAVEEGRAIFANIRKFLRYLLASNIGEVMAMFFGVVLAGVLGLKAAEGEAVVLPLLATQLLWINLVSDGLPALALGLDPASPRLMQQPPRAPGERVITGRMWRGIFFTGAVAAAATLLMLDFGMPGGLLEGNGSLSYGQTLAFTTLVLVQVFNAFNARSEDESAFKDLCANRWLFLGLGLSVLLQVAVVYLPPLQAAFGTVRLSGSDWLACTLAASSVLWLNEAGKALRRRAKDQGPRTKDQGLGTRD